MAATWELAAQGRHGEWDLLGDFAAREEAIKAARELAEAGAVHCDDGGGAVFGLSDDPQSGHYEERVGIWIEEGKSVVVDPMP